MSKGIIKLYASGYNRLSQICRILNNKLIQDKELWIVLPTQYVDYILTDIIEIGKSTTVTSELREGHIFRISFDQLNTSTGLHQYEIYLKHPITSDLISCYFQYIIQNDNPETPYIYMNREENKDATENIFEQDVSR